MARPRARLTTRVAPALTLLALAAPALAVSGCGGSDDAPVRARDGRVTIEMRDYFFDPQAVLARPGRLELTLVNRSRVAHNFRLQRQGRYYAEVLALKPGERQTVTTRGLIRGDYRMFCSIANHEELGMYGSLNVGA